MHTVILFLDIIAVANILLVAAAMFLGWYINTKVLSARLYELNGAAYVTAGLSTAWLIATSLT